MGTVGTPGLDLGYLVPRCRHVSASPCFPCLVTPGGDSLGSVSGGVPAGRSRSPTSLGPQPAPTLPYKGRKAEPETPRGRETQAVRGRGGGSQRDPCWRKPGRRQVSAAAGGCCSPSPSAGARAPAAGPAGNCSALCGSGGEGARGWGGGQGLPLLGSPAEARRIRTSMVPARAWAEPSRKGPGPHRSVPLISRLQQSRAARGAPRRPRLPCSSGGLIRVGGRADLPEVGCGRAQRAGCS